MMITWCLAKGHKTQVGVRRDWNNGRSATYLLDEIEGWHWSDVSGGWHAKAPRKFLHGYDCCNDLIDGELDQTYPYLKSDRNYSRAGAVAHGGVPLR